ncbi:hypothetical protein HK405_004520 [Cladochytrium tenue]|nr:hypothetical protein HK405_004520 [Cladochytrium tenue]
MTFGTNYVILQTTSSSVGPYVLYSCALSSAPIISSAPVGATYLQVPLNATAISGDGLSGFVDRLGHRKYISHISAQLATSPCLAALGAASISYGATTTPSGADFLLGPAVTALVAAETHPLARAEWMYFVDAFYGLQSAPSVFAAAETQYNCIAGKTSARTSDLPAVAVSAFNSASQLYYTPDSSYWSRLIVDAGANAIVMPAAGGSFAEWAAAVADADALIDLTPAGQPYTITGWSKNYNGLVKTSSGYQFLDGDQSTLFRPDARDVESYDAFPQARHAQPDLVAADLLYRLAVGFNPSMLPYYFRNLADDIVLPTTDTCADTSAGFNMYLSDQYCNSSSTYTPTIGRFSSSATSTSTASSSSSSSGLTSVAAGLVAAAAAVLIVVGAVLLALFVVIPARRRARARHAAAASAGAFTKMSEDEEGAGGALELDAVRLRPAPLASVEPPASRDPLAAASQDDVERWAVSR